MDEKDRPEFVALMNYIAEISKGKEIPSDNKIMFYFEILRDMDLNQIRNNATLYFRMNRGSWFPSIAELRGGEDEDLKAARAYEIISDLCKNWLFPEFPQAGRNVIKMKLGKQGLGYLMPLVDNWGGEFVSGNNPTATRAQFKTAFKALENKRVNAPLIESGEIHPRIESGIKQILGKLE